MTKSLEGIAIRLMTIGDYEQVYDLWINTPGMGLNSIDDTREGIAKYLKRNPTTCFVAVDGGEIAGVILCGHDGRRGVVHHTAVKESLRRRGVGKALWDQAAAALRKDGITKAWLVVKGYNEGGNLFWEGLDFQQRDDLKFKSITLDQTLVRIDT